ncbi:MAG TPA: serine/threonine-protein kinase [Planctomycetota bacterium]|jgi:serine/threonine-protein kinase|nr:serine/threonine-protein kinase [Planctomycetota bacterium]
MAPVNLKGYMVIDKIKDGSVGTVWRGVNSQKKTFALKQIALKNANDSSKMRAFEKEANLTKKLSHPNIIRVYDYVDAKPQPFFVMEFFESENLKYAMAHVPERVVKKEFQILMGVADALAYVHAQGIVHKDIKPENVLINSRSEVRLIDFSLAQTKWDRLLQFGKKIEGTPLYMAPEQIRGERCDARSDMYSFGVMMYEMLAKRPLFMADSHEKVLQKHLNDAPIPLSAILPTVSRDIDAFVLRLLAKKSEHRYADMTTVMQELSRWNKCDTVMRMRQVVDAPLQYSEEATSSAPA